MADVRARRKSLPMIKFKEEATVIALKSEDKPRVRRSSTNDKPKMIHLDIPRQDSSSRLSPITQRKVHSPRNGLSPRGILKSPTPETPRSILKHSTSNSQVSQPEVKCSDKNNNSNNERRRRRSVDYNLYQTKNGNDLFDNVNSNKLNLRKRSNSIIHYEAQLDSVKEGASLPEGSMDFQAVMDQFRQQLEVRDC